MHEQASSAVKHTYMLLEQSAHATGEGPMLVASSIPIANERGKDSIVTTQPEYTTEKMVVTSQRPSHKPSVDMELDMVEDGDSVTPSKSCWMHLASKWSCCGR